MLGDNHLSLGLFFNHFVFTAKFKGQASPCFYSKGDVNNAFDSLSVSAPKHRVEIAKDAWPQLPRSGEPIDVEISQDLWQTFSVREVNFISGGDWIEILLKEA